MQDNPYQALLGTMQSSARKVLPPAVAMGRVSALSPLTVLMGDMALSGNDLLVNAALLPRFCDVSASGLNGSVEATMDGEMKRLAMKGGMVGATAALGYALDVGDKVLLLPVGEEPTYVVLCKVVAL